MPTGLEIFIEHCMSLPLMVVQDPPLSGAVVTKLFVCPGTCHGQLDDDDTRSPGESHAGVLGGGRPGGVFRRTCHAPFQSVSPVTSASLLGAKGIVTRSNDATRGSWP